MGVEAAMVLILLKCLSSFVLGLGLLIGQAAWLFVAPAEFERTIAPILIRNCLGCHNPSEASGGLDLTRSETARKGGETGPALVPARPADSLLLERAAEGSMPPRKLNQRLKADEVAALKRWIEAGADWPSGRVLSVFELTTDKRAGTDWWSLQPVASVTPPALSGVENPIDAFLLNILRQRGLDMSPAADRAVLLRRAKFDLLGLPPTPEEIADFVNDPDPNAYARLLDRLLASPHYGERWGRHWLDVVRYGESDGFENDRLRDHAWRYRDYVVRSLNADKPYDRFVLEQLAGDVLEPITHEGITATGFLVAGPWDEIQNVAVSKLEKQRAHEEQMEEILAAVGQTFLGMTVHCARCHDHKFDPVPQADYYRLKAVFDGVDHGNMPLQTPAEKQTHDELVGPLQKRIAELKAHLAAETPNLDKVDESHLAEGKFGRGLDARKGHVVTRLSPTVQQPPFAVECWARLESKAGFNILVASSLKESSEHWEIYSYAGSGEFSAYLPGYAPAEIKSGVDITDNVWRHLAMTFDGQRVRLFIDARLVKEQEVVRQRAGGESGLLWIGAYPPQKIGCAGCIDEVCLFRGVREFDALPAGPAVKDEQTVALWSLDEPAPARQPGRLAFEQQATLRRLEAEAARLAPPLAYSGVRRQPGPVHVLLRGDVQKPAEVALPAGLSHVRARRFELPSEAPEGLRRLKFAEWVVDPNNPLTARVMVNRLWQQHFGQGLVETPSDFGFNGGRPSHPELLDWLAGEFMASGWSVKHMHRLIMTSAAYRQASTFDPRAARIDADNRLLWRFSPRRLEAEIVRDAMLAVGGNLNRQMEGPSFKPFTITVHNHNFYHLLDLDAPEFNRRSLYRMNVNTGRSPFMDALDCPAPSLSAPKRRHTTTPLHALALMNDPFVLRQAEKFAQRVEREAGGRVEEQVERACWLALGRLPREGEKDGLVRHAREQGLASLCWVLLNLSEFVQVT